MRKGISKIKMKEKRVAWKVKVMCIIAIGIIGLCYFGVDRASFFVNSVKAQTIPESIPFRQGKVYKVTSKDKPVKTSKVNQYTTLNKKTANYYMIRSYMEKFEKEGGGTLILAKGKYLLTNTIYVPSNVTILFEDGVTIHKKMKTGNRKVEAATSMFQLVAPSKAYRKHVYGKYNGEKNIHFVGQGNVIMDLQYTKGSIAIIAGHNKNVTVSGITFQNMNDGHFLEVDATKNMKVSDCTFKNCKIGSDYVKEAINIDTPDKETKGFSEQWSKFDKTPNCGVEIKRCSFTKMGRAIGTHKYSAIGKKQMYHKNVVITDCHIFDMYYDSPIRVMNWKNPVISNNQIENIHQKGKKEIRGILVSGCLYPTIQDNAIKNVGRPIQFIAWKNDGPGGKYPITYNRLNEKNKNALRTNRCVNMETGEYFVRICAKYNVFDKAEKIDVIRVEE